MQAWAHTASADYFRRRDTKTKPESQSKTNTFRKAKGKRSKGHGLDKHATEKSLEDDSSEAFVNITLEGSTVICTDIQSVSDLPFSDSGLDSSAENVNTYSSRSSKAGDTACADNSKIFLSGNADTSCIGPTTLPDEINNNNEAKDIQSSLTLIKSGVKEKITDDNDVSYTNNEPENTHNSDYTEDSPNSAARLIQNPSRNSPRNDSGVDMHSDIVGDCENSNSIHSNNNQILDDAKKREKTFLDDDTTNSTNTGVQENHKEAAYASGTPSPYMDIDNKTSISRKENFISCGSKLVPGYFETASSNLTPHQPFYSGRIQRPAVSNITRDLNTIDRLGELTKLKWNTAENGRLRLSNELLYSLSYNSMQHYFRRKPTCIISRSSNIYPFNRLVPLCLPMRRGN